jgi:outer membrane lipoprotein-sorting protein
MSETNHRPTPDILGEATAALRAAPVPAGPPAELAAATAAAIQNRLAGVVPAEAARLQRRRRIMRYVRYGSAVAVAAGLLVAVGVIGFGGGSASAFDKAADKAAAAKSARFKYTHKVTGQPEVSGKGYAQGGRLRMEKDDLALVVDFKARKALKLMTASKTAALVDIPAALGEMVPNPIEQLARAKGKKAGRTGEEEVGGVKAEVFRVEDAGLFGLEAGPDGEFTIWVDPKTELPVRIRLTYKNGEATHSYLFEGFVWNEDIDPKLLSLDVPEGYKLLDK